MKKLSESFQMSQKKMTSEYDHHPFPSQGFCVLLFKLILLVLGNYMVKLFVLQVEEHIFHNYFFI